MELNKYLKIKTAAAPLSIPPHLLRPQDVNAPIPLLTVPKDGYVPPESKFTSQRILELDSLYNKLVPENSKLYSPAATVKSPNPYNWFHTVIMDQSNPKASMNIRPYVEFSDTGSIFAYLHERGHINDWEKNHTSEHIHDLYSPKYNSGHQPMPTVLERIGKSAIGKMLLGENNALQNITYKRLLGDEIYSSRAIRNELARERAARQYVYDVLSTIKDPAVRERALKDAREEGEAAYNTYAAHLEPLLKYNKIGGTIGALGLGAGLGYYGYHGGDRFADYMKWTGKKRWLARIAGALGLGALGAYGGAHLGSIGGQMYFNRYKRDAADKVYDENRARYEAAKNKFNKADNIRYLTDYINTSS